MEQLKIPPDPKHNNFLKLPKQHFNTFQLQIIVKFSNNLHKETAFLQIFSKLQPEAD